MICYRDRTFCNFYKECSNGNICTIALTKEIIKKAKNYGLPICQYVDKPDCFKNKV